MVHGKGTIDFVCGDVVEATRDSVRFPIGVGHDVIELLPVELGCLKEGEGSHHIGAGEGERVLDGTVHMRLSRQVDDSVHLLLLHELVEGLEVADVHSDEPVIRLVLNVLEVLEVAGIGQLVEVYDPVVRVFVDEKSHYMTADEAGTTCYDYCSFHNLLIY